MTAERATKWWEFDGSLTDNSLIKCPNCGAVTPLERWQEGEVSCEDCGSHAAMVCPDCDHGIDHVWAEPIHVHQPSDL